MVESLVWAQAADPISGGAGWVGAGLLGLVLGWLLLKHLPDKDRQIEKLIGTHDTRCGAMTDQFLKSLNEHYEACAAERKENAERQERMTEKMAAAVDALTAKLATVRGGGR